MARFAYHLICIFLQAIPISYIFSWNARFMEWYVLTSLARMLNATSRRRFTFNIRVDIGIRRVNGYDYAPVHILHP